VKTVLVTVKHQVGQQSQASTETGHGYVGCVRRCCRIWLYGIKGGAARRHQPDGLPLRSRPPAGHHDDIAPHPRASLAGARHEAGPSYAWRSFNTGPPASRALRVAGAIELRSTLDAVDPVLTAARTRGTAECRCLNRRPRRYVLWMHTPRFAWSRNHHGTGRDGTGRADTVRPGQARPSLQL